MIRAIYKYPLPLTGVPSSLDLPVGSRVLTAQMQGGNLFIWAEVDPEAPIESRFFRIFATGLHHGVDFSRYLYLATIQDGPFVWHVYEMMT